ncbi:MAG TPA: DUF2341 domain-containing protein, partial [Candidatus Woesebacteria bacterium]|nr:DUF2341 domain-containing protein [Candidatus Woesebacteria bacterium]
MKRFRKLITKDSLIKLSIVMIVPLQLSLNLFDNVTESIGNVLAAASPWVQTDWSGGQSSSIVTGTVNTYLSETDINTITPYNLTLSQTNGWPVDLADWAKRTVISINNSMTEQTNYQVRIPVTYDEDMQADFDDLRFTNSAGTSLDYWLENKVDSTSAIIWVEVDTLTVGGDTLIYMYYGNGSTSSISSGLNTFILFDDFTADTLDPKWTVGGTNVYTLSNDRLNLGP